jgi:hypothetical protein
VITDASLMPASLISAIAIAARLVIADTIIAAARWTRPPTGSVMTGDGHIRDDWR